MNFAELRFWGYLVAALLLVVAIRPIALRCAANRDQELVSQLQRI